jgi:Ca-activated chloride channel family protein
LAKKQTSKYSNNECQYIGILLILDASGSMRKSNKFGIVKKILVDFIKQRKTDKLALSIFADFAYTAVPLTYDKKSIINK